MTRHRTAVATGAICAVATVSHPPAWSPGWAPRQGRGVTRKTG
jgi:hypothetical protein